MKSLEHHAAVAEGALGLAARRGERLGQRGRVAHHAHALAAAAGHRLDEERETDRLRLARQMPLVLLGAEVAGHDRHARLLHRGSWPHP